MILCAGLIVYLVSVKVLLTPEQQLSLGTAVAFMAVLCWMYFPLESLWLGRQAKQDGIEVASRIQRYLDQIPAVGQMVGAKFLSPLSKLLEFDRVSYTHPTSKKSLLNELALKIPAGRKIALISTDPQEAWAVASLLPRFIDPQMGRVKIDGEDISRVTLDSLRAEVACVWAQESFFSGTVRENLAMGSENLTLPQIVEAAKMSHAHNFISLLPHGYETMIGEHGEDLDDGQAFRLSLARACLRNPALIVIEEPAKKLDDATKDLIDDAYQRIEAGRSIIFLPSRLSTLRRADEIVLLHQGKVAAIGPHAQLVKKDQLYRHWEYVHFNEFRHQVELQAETV
jgi:ABC-type multidrug transport system fused ATPase/permease subunit